MREQPLGWQGPSPPGGIAVGSRIFRYIEGPWEVNATCSILRSLDPTRSPAVTDILVRRTRPK